MTDPLQSLTNAFAYAVKYLILAIEALGVSVLVFAVLRALCQLYRHKRAVRLHLAEGIGLALEIKMVGELLRTVIVHEIGELAILGAVILLRAAIALLVHFEIVSETRAENARPTHNQEDSYEKTVCKPTCSRRDRGARHRTLVDHRPPRQGRGHRRDL